MECSTCPRDLAPRHPGSVVVETCMTWARDRYVHHGMGGKRPRGQCPVPALIGAAEGRDTE